jgi:RNA polymerase sigma-70 factor, ECF subfamily
MQYITDATPTFETFYTRYVNLVRHVLSHSYASHNEHIDDLVQETFVRAWKAYERLDQSQNVTGWLCRIAHNTARDLLRHLKACHRLDCPLETDDGMIHDIADLSQDEPAVYVEESDTIAHAYRQLCADDQQIMALLFQEYAPKEIAAVLHLSKEACRARINRARRRFQKHYTQA